MESDGILNVLMTEYLQQNEEISHSSEESQSHEIQIVGGDTGCDNNQIALLFETGVLSAIW